MPKFSIENFGCRATEADTTAIRHTLLEQGLELDADPSTADFVILNTCTVTAAADQQAREAVRKIHRANPQARVILTGCYAQRAPEEAAALEGVSFVVGNSRQSEIPGLLREFLAGSSASRTRGAGNDFVPLASFSDAENSYKIESARILTGDIFAQSEVPTAPAAHLAADRTRPVLKVQDGCNNRCSYCVIPFVRGRSRSLPPAEILQAVRELVQTGAKEIVLSGINLGSYGRDLLPRESLLEVTKRILDETAIQRLRFSSIEPQDVTEDLAQLVAESDRLARHFHVPLQSGCDRILHAMHRWYRTAHYAERIERIRRILPDAAIGADVIVGFPGETDEEFQTTVDFIGRLPFTYLHVFSFSERPGTEAAKLGERVSPTVIRDRARILRAVSHEKTAAFRATMADDSNLALTLARTGEGWTEAITGNYLKVRIRGIYPANEWRQVRLMPAESDVVESWS
jgi:threonylcarbamoyladenosine tRNA methylthiotransferase MtaB